jgi:hypothetical protein
VEHRTADEPISLVRDKIEHVKAAITNLERVLTAS